MLWKTCWSNEKTNKNKIKVFNTNVRSVLLYTSEICSTNTKMLKRISTFINKGPREILKIYYPKIVPNEKLWKRCNLQFKPVQNKIKKTSPLRLGIGHILRKEKNRHNNDSTGIIVLLER